MNAAYQARKAIESLRAGVPNSAAASVLGIQEPVILDRFIGQCDRGGFLPQAAPIKRGFLIEGNFGSGKSHVLRYLQAVAAKRNMAYSSIAVSKETPLGDLSAVYRSAISSLKLRDATLGGSLGVVFDRFDLRSPAFATFFANVYSASASLHPLFRASLMVFKHHRNSPEIVEQLYEFWDGGPAQLGAWKGLLRGLEGCDALPRSVPLAQVAPDRFRFAASCLVAGGASGWYIALDEVELIAKFSLKARGQAYGNIAFLFSDDQDYDISKYWFVVGAVTADLLTVVLRQRDDLRVLSERYRWDDSLVGGAERGVAILSDRARVLPLRELNSTDLAGAHERIRGLYSTAYDCPVDKAFSGSSGRLSKSIRQYVREWIAYWDLTAQDRNFDPQIVSREIDYSLDEDDDLEAASA